jgi:hypothetical protein
MPFANVLFLGCNLVFAGGKKEAPFAPQVTAIGHIIDGTADIELGDIFIPLIPMVIEERTDCYHDFYELFKGGSIKVSQRFDPLSYPLTQTAR